MDLKITPSGQTIVKPTALGPGANTDTKLLIYGLFQKGRVLAQDGVHGYNTKRLMDLIGNIPPIEQEMNYYRSRESPWACSRSINSEQGKHPRDVPTRIVNVAFLQNGLDR